MLLLLLALMQAAPEWDEAIDAAPDVVADGYRRGRWPYDGQKWREVVRCDAPGAFSVANERSCLVCSIDFVGGARLGERRLPPTAVAVRASYALFRRDDRFAWRLDSYEPFGSNYLAENGEPRHQASTRWIKDLAVGECRSLEENGSTVTVTSPRAD